MDAFMKKIRHKPDFLEEQAGDLEDPTEQALADDDTFPESGFAGKLSFAQGDGDFAKDTNETGRLSYIQHLEEFTRKLVMKYVTVLFELKLVCVGFFFPIKYPLSNKRL
jgi:hypothetical protein